MEAKSRRSKRVTPGQLRGPATEARASIPFPKGGILPCVSVRNNTWGQCYAKISKLLLFDFLLASMVIFLLS
jgi:hypothetical protein